MHHILPSHSAQYAMSFGPTTSDQMCVSTHAPAQREMYSVVHCLSARASSLSRLNVAGGQ